MDLRGCLATGLDFFGQPIYTSTRGHTNDNFVVGWNTNAWTSGDTDSPYELKLGRISPHALEHNARLDNPFSVAEFERFLRHYDADAQRLPSRLHDLLLETGPNPAYRWAAALDQTTPAYRLNTTTASWDVPAPAMSVPDELRTTWNTAGRGLPLHLTDLIAARAESLYQANRTSYQKDDDDDPSTPDITVWAFHSFGDEWYYPYFNAKSGSSDPDWGTAWRINERALLSPDLLAGLRMDLNRPFTNYAQRVEYARSLYVLMMLLVDKEWYPPWDEQFLNPPPPITGGSMTPSETQFYMDQRNAIAKARSRARAIAQWAVNIVDARDADGIMTGFEYDIYPFAAHVSSFAQGAETITTWNVDNDLTTDENGLFIDDANDFRGVVWGCERPELLITETLATHDRGIADTANDVTGQLVADGDDDWDQKYRPRGSLFVELYNPWGFTEQGPEELYPNLVPGATGYGVQLGRITPNTGGHHTPVWRLAVTRGNDEGAYKDPDDDYAWDATETDRYDRLVYFVPNTYDPADTDTTMLVRDSEDSYEATVFYTTTASTYPIAPQSYAVIGSGDNVQVNKSGGGTEPAILTRIGLSVVGSNELTETEAVRQIRFADPDEDGIFDSVHVNPDGKIDTADNNRSVNLIEKMTAAGVAKAPLGIVIDRAVPYSLDNGATQNFADPEYTGWADRQTWPRYLSVSEPDVGYEADGYPDLDNSEDGDRVYDLEKGYGVNSGDTFAVLRLDEREDASAADWADVLSKNGTIPMYRYLHLQRLADPTRPYNRDTNPYLTIDSSTVDLTVFNTASSTADPEVTSSPYAFCSRQRGEPAKEIVKGALNDDRLLSERFWTSIVPVQEVAVLDDRDYPNCEMATNLDGSVTGTHQFDESLGQTLGFCNEFFFGGAAGYVDPNYYGAPLDPSDYKAPNGEDLLAVYRGAPGNSSATDFQPAPFPWFQWLNRPFANACELMDVPATSPSRLLVSYANNDMEEVDYHGGGSAVERAQFLSGQGHFPHLINFFAAEEGKAVEGPMRGSSFYAESKLIETENKIEAKPTHLYHVLEYVHVPSRFVDSQIRGDDSATGLGNPSETHDFHPPFNFIPTYREPGKINLNTISNQAVWNCLRNDHDVESSVARQILIDYALLSSDTVGEKKLKEFNRDKLLDLYSYTREARYFALSRRGYGTVDYGTQNQDGDAFYFDATSPTRFARPFRAAANVNCVPLDALADTARGGNSVTSDVGVDATLLRSTWDNAQTDINAESPFFTSYENPQEVTLKRLAATDLDGNGVLDDLEDDVPQNNSYYRPLDNPRENPHFKYQSLQRLSNLVTNRSNVYALWITVGYFEVEKYDRYLPTANGNFWQTNVYPGGYTLGQELGVDTGEVKRHRAFYIIDRSIPAGFIPGQDLNTEKAVLLRRFIE